MKKLTIFIRYYCIGSALAVVGFLVYKYAGAFALLWVLKHLFVL